MTRRRSSAPGTLDPARRRSLLPLLPLVALIAVGCIGAAEVQPSTAQPSASASVAPSDSPAPSVTPTPTDSPAPTEAPTALPSEAPTESPSSATGSAEACAGTDDNRSFYADVTRDVEWPVYCPVLPSGWFVTLGTYRLAGGGWMQIAYRGPGGVRLELSEGAFCDVGDDCVPDGADAGPAAFGDLAGGTLVELDNGDYAVAVDQGKKFSWLAIGSGLDLDSFKGIVATLNHIQG